EELWGCHADHREGSAVDHDLLTDGVDGISKPALAVPQAEDSYRRGARAIVAGIDEAASARRHLQTAEEIAGDGFTLRDFGLALDDHIHAPAGLVGEEAGQHGRRRLVQALERREREDGAAHSRGIPNAPARDVSPH